MEEVVNEIQVQSESQALENLIKQHCEALDNLRQELSAARDMFNDSFNNNPTYREHDERVKEVAKAKAQVRLVILKQPSVANLEQKIKDIRFDINERNLTLSALLLEYKSQTKATQLDLFGETLEIVETAKLVKKSKKYNL
jgi:transcriptional regulator of met regulon